MNYTNITYEQILKSFKDRLASDPRFKNIGSSAIYGMFMEMISAVTEMTNFYIQRTAEESFIETARLDSSVIKHGKNLGYNPRRAVPARCELAIRLKGPLPSVLRGGDEIIFGQKTTKLSFNGYNYILDSGYSYVLTEEDIESGKASDWSKTLTFSVPAENAEYLPRLGYNVYSSDFTNPIKCFQGEERTVEFLGTANTTSLNETCQYYDINDLEFSNWYGKRDPFSFRNGAYNKEYSWCKVGIGKTEDEAFNIAITDEDKDGRPDDHLYAVEDQSIFLNDEVVKLDGITPDVPKKVCLIDTNSDKTVRITFSSERYICDCGLKTADENLYVKYIATKGKQANIIGVTGSIMTHSNKIYVSTRGSTVDVTNNVQFIINSDIYGGDDFESQESIKINAPMYFSSRGKLITHDDYVSYFRSLTSPIQVQNALVFGQDQVEDNGDKFHTLIQNNVIYCLLGHLYLKNDGNWDVRNVLTGDTNGSDAFTLYGEDYLNHLVDYMKFIYSFEGFYNSQQGKPGSNTEQWQRNIQLLNDEMHYKAEILSRQFSLPPYIQYFDAVGTVYVNDLTDIEKYTNEMKNKVYAYLDNKLSTDRKIYRSEIIKLYNEHPATIAADIDFKVSDIIKSGNKQFKWGAPKNSYGKYNLFDNGAWYVVNDPTEGPSASDLTGHPYNGTIWNELFINKKDSYGSTIDTDMFNSTVTVIFSGTTRFNEPFTKTITDKFNATDAGNFIKLIPSTAYLTYVEYDENEPIYMAIDVATDDDFYSSTELSKGKWETAYGLSKIDDYEAIIQKLTDWLNGLQTVDQANRAIPLPYEVMTNTVTTRSETIMRKGYIKTVNEKTLSEYTFWNYFVKDILDNFYSEKATNIVRSEYISDDTEFDADIWVKANNLIMDIYRKVKSGICDSILDNNNNIVNFSTAMECAALFNKITVKHYNR